MGKKWAVVIVAVVCLGVAGCRSSEEGRSASDRADAPTFSLSSSADGGDASRSGDELNAASASDRGDRGAARSRDAAETDEADAVEEVVAASDVDVDDDDRAVVEGSGQATKQARSEQAIVEIAPGLRVDRSSRAVFIDGWVATDAGFLEQVVCLTGTRDHESLVATEVSPSAVHAALLLAGFEPGSPGRWQLQGSIVERIAPTGDALEVDVLWTDDDGRSREATAESWIVDFNDGDPFPRSRFIFGGSELRENTPAMVRLYGEGEHYVADMNGSIIGLVTFGDEPIGLESVIADQVGVDAAEWTAHTGVMPEAGTDVTVRVRAWSGG